MSSPKPIQLTFGDVQFHVLQRDGEPWLRAGQIAQALGYSDQRDLLKLYRRRADEFTDKMTAVATLPDLRGGLVPSGQMREVRIFSLRGAHLLAMHSNTTWAKVFRIWALDVLDGKAAPAVKAVAQPDLFAQPAPDLTAKFAELEVKLAHSQTQTQELKDRLLASLSSELQAFKDLHLAKPKRTSKRREPITAAEMEAMRKLHADGMSNTAIAKKLGRSTASVSWAVRAKVAA